MASCRYPEPVLLQRLHLLSYWSSISEREGGRGHRCMELTGENLFRRWMGWMGDKRIPTDQVSSELYFLTNMYQEDRCISGLLATFRG